jgi:hypothetical protein
MPCPAHSSAMRAAKFEISPYFPPLSGSVARRPVRTPVRPSRSFAGVHPTCHRCGGSWAGAICFPPGPGSNLAGLSREPTLELSLRRGVVLSGFAQDSRGIGKRSRSSHRFSFLQSVFGPLQRCRVLLLCITFPCRILEYWPRRGNHAEYDRRNFRSSFRRRAKRHR